jgi:hypothetical protein
MKGKLIGIEVTIVGSLSYVRPDVLLLLLSVGLPVANAPDAMQLIVLPVMFKLSPPVVSPRDPGSQRWS